MYIGMNHRLENPAEFAKVCLLNFWARTELRNLLYRQPESRIRKDSLSSKTAYLALVSSRAVSLEDPEPIVSDPERLFAAACQLLSRESMEVNRNSLRSAGRTHHASLGKVMMESIDSIDDRNGRVRPSVVKALVPKRYKQFKDFMITSNELHLFAFKELFGAMRSALRHVPDLTVSKLELDDSLWVADERRSTPYRGYPVVEFAESCGFRLPTGFVSIASLRDAKQYSAIDPEDYYPRATIYHFPERSKVEGLHAVCWPFNDGVASDTQCLLKETARGAGWDQERFLKWAADMSTEFILEHEAGHLETENAFVRVLDDRGSDTDVYWHDRYAMEIAAEHSVVRMLEGRDDRLGKILYVLLAHLVTCEDERPDMIRNYHFTKLTALWAIICKDGAKTMMDVVEELIAYRCSKEGSDYDTFQAGLKKRMTEMKTEAEGALSTWLKAMT